MQLPVFRKKRQPHLRCVGVSCWNLGYQVFVGIRWALPNYVTVASACE